MVDDPVRAAELAVLVADRVEAVRAGGHDRPLPHPVAVERLDVARREHLEDVVVAHPAGRVAGARLLLAEDREATRRPRAGRSRPPGRPSGCAGRTPPRSRPSRGPRARRAAPAAATSATIGTSNGKASGPVEPGRRRLAPRVALVLHRPERGRQLRREAALLEHEVPAQPDDLVDVLDEHRAGLDARPAGDAVPDRVVRDGVVDDRSGERGGARVACRRDRTSRARSASSGSGRSRARPRPTSRGCP